MIESIRMWAALAAFEFIEKSEEAMSIVKDMSLAPSGLQKIQWVRDFMPALSGIEERFRKEKPFAG